MPPQPSAPSARTALRRHRERGAYDRATIDAILDEGFLCHAAVAVDEVCSVIPTIYARVGDDVYLHGATGNHVLGAAGAGATVTVTVTLVDGVVLARSAMHHSMNFRSVVIFGRAEEVTASTEKTAALAAVVDHLLPGRTAEARPPSTAELRATRVLRLSLAEASAKVRTAGPADDEADLALPVWAGVLPLRQAAGRPQPVAGLDPNLSPPAALAQPERWVSVE